MWPFKKKRKEMRLRFLTPSSSCPLPIGNGSMGVFLSGGVGSERCDVYKTMSSTFEEENLKALQKLDGKKISDSIKKELNLGNLSVAENMMTKSLLENGFKETESKSSLLLNIDIVFHRSSPALDYRRVLDMESGLFTVSFADREGVEYRDSFVSQDDNIFCYRAYRDRGEINCEVSLSRDAEEFNIKEESNYLIFTRRINGREVGFVLGAIASGGKVTYLNEALHITKCDRFYLFGESFDCLEAESDEKVSQIIQKLNKKDITFDKIFKDSRAVFQKRMNKSLIEFSTKEVENIDMELLLGKSSGLSQNMMDVLYNYGKYLSLSLGKVAMYSKSFVLDNTSLDLNYLKATRLFLGLLNMGEENEVASYLKNIFDNKEILEQNAKYLYNAEGIFVPVIKDEKGLIASFSPKVLLNKAGTFLVGMIAFELYKRTSDEDLKNNILPEIIKGCSDFYMSFFKTDRNSKVVYSPFGISPYTKVRSTGEMISSHCTCDYVCARYLLHALSNVSGEKEKYEDLISKIPDIVVDKNGIIKEYDAPTSDEVISPYLPYLLPYIVGVKNTFGTREYENVLSSSVKSKYLSAFGSFSSRSLLDMALGLSTLSEGADSYEVLSLLCRTFMLNNLLFSNCDNSNMAVGKGCDDEYINIDINVALTQALQNMLINQSGDNIYLPNTFAPFAMPIRARNILLTEEITCQIDLNVKRGVMKFVFLSKKDKCINIHLPQTYRKHKSKTGLIDRENLCIKEVNLLKNKSHKVVVYF